jgi:hypothetical protein
MPDEKGWLVLSHIYQRIKYHGRDMQWQAQGTLLHTFPTLASHHKITLTDKCVEYLRARSKTVYSWAVKTSHFLEEIAKN